MQRALIWTLVLLGYQCAQATRLPIKTFTTADGLARDHVLCIFQDSHGFIWFCTAEGLSRFDGYQFANYRTEQGLPSNVIQDFLETRTGKYWIATAGGLCSFEPAGGGKSRFDCYPITGERAIRAPTFLYEDRAGGVWCGSDALYHRGRQDDVFRELRLPAVGYTAYTSVLVDRRDTLWVGSSAGLYRRAADGSSRMYTTADGLPNNYVMAVVEDGEGNIWVGTRVGLARLAASDSGMRVFDTRDGLPGVRIESLLTASDGTLWVGTNLGLAERIHGKPGAGTREFQRYTLAQGLSARAVGALAEDRDGNLWIGTFGSGAMKVAHRGFVTYSEADGVPMLGALMESRQGEWLAVTREETDLRIIRFDGRRFSTVHPAWPKSIAYFGWGRGQIALEDRCGEWWFATGDGLCRFDAASRVEKLDRRAPKAVYTRRDGLPSSNIFRVFEDSRGDIWIGTIGRDQEDGLARWSRRDGTIRVFGQADGLPERPLPTAFGEDRYGGIWVGLFHGGLARYSGGRFTTYLEDGQVHGKVRSIYNDARGRIWVATTRGLLRIDDPHKVPPKLVTYTTADGLSSDYIAAVIEDGRGRIYAATGRGVDRFEPRPEGPRQVKHFTTADGIAPGELELALRDHSGGLWFTTPLGLSHIETADDTVRTPPPVLLTGVIAGGVAHHISDLGETSMKGLRLTRTPLRIDFVGLDFSPGEALRYQYMLEGAESAWGSPTDQRSVVYANLAPGNYRFLVRAVTSDGSVSAHAATLGFQVMPPFWRTWWFLSGCTLGALLMGFAIHRYRVSQLLAVANVRTRIATDLHDDIGASLSQIAILSEVAQRSLNGTATREAAPLAEIAGISRELVDSMSDIVWAINPDHDHLSNLIFRMRRFAYDLLPGRGMRMQFQANVADRDLRIGADTRRQVYLIFKEALHNAVRHSGAHSVDIQVNLEGEQQCLRLEIHDDGSGFNAHAHADGHGLMNMQRRSAALGGSLVIESIEGRGTTVVLHTPLPAHKTWSALERAAKTLAALRGK